MEISQMTLDTESETNEIQVFEDDDVIIIDNDTDKIIKKPELTKSITLAGDGKISIELKTSNRRTRTKRINFPIKEYASRLEHTIQSVSVNWQAECMRSISLDRLDLFVN